MTSQPPLGPWPQGWLDAAIFLVLVLLATVLGGLLPKAWVLHRPEATALQLAPLLEALHRTLAPLLAVALIAALNRSTVS